jgi:hypothetical protein
MDQHNSSEDLSAQTSLSVVRRLLAPPATQDQRISSASLGLVSLVSSAGIYLLRGISSLTLPGLLISAGLGGVAWWVGRKYPRQKGVAYLLAGVAGVTLLNALPALSGIGGFILGFSGLATLAFGIWKLGTTVYSIFRRKSSDS